MELLLHAGQHKTGTTSIQQYIANNRDYFLSHGIYIPVTGQIIHLGNHHTLIQDLGLNGGDELLSDLKSEIAQQDASKILISGEVFKNYIVENRCHGILDLFRTTGIAKFKIIMYIRNPFQLINSAYCEQTKSLSTKGSDIDDYVGKYVDRKYLGHYRFFDYARVIELAREHDVELVLRPYSKTVAGSVVTDFLAALGISCERILSEPRTNVSPGPIAIAALRAINKEIDQIEISNRRKLIGRINKLLDNFPESTSYWGICEDVAASEALAKADRQTERLSRFAWGKSWRDVIGDYHRPANVFHPETASADQIETYERMLDRMRMAVKEEIR